MLGQPREPWARLEGAQGSRDPGVVIPPTSDSWIGSHGQGRGLCSQNPACSSTGSSPDTKARVQSLAQTPPNLILGDILLFSLETK